MIKRILQYNIDEDRKILTKKSEPVKNINAQEIKEIIENLKDTLSNTKNGKGLSAVQIGDNVQICICNWGGKEIVMINPEIIRTRGEQKFLEGCLSAPNKEKEVLRYQKVWCKYLDEEGKEQIIAEGGRMSNIIQHEMDHFNGICQILN